MASSPSPPTPPPASGGRTDCALYVQREQQTADSHLPRRFAIASTNATSMVRTILLTNWARLMLIIGAQHLGVDIGFAVENEVCYWRSGILSA